jgi:hypothetical protein
MKIRWWIVGIVAAAAGSMLLIRHLVDNKKTFLNFVGNTTEKSLDKFPGNVLESEYDDADFIA